MNVFSRVLLPAAMILAGTAQAQTQPMMPDRGFSQAPGQGQFSGQAQAQFPGQAQGQFPGAMQGQFPAQAQGQMPGAQPAFVQQGGPQAAPPPAQAASPVLPPMTLSRQFAGPLPETAIQRFVDPDTGVLCYLYTPYRVPHERNESGVLIYGANHIGSISCVAPGTATRPAAAQPLSALPAGQAVRGAQEVQPQGGAPEAASAATPARGAAQETVSPVAKSAAPAAKPAAKSSSSTRNSKGR
ncbi:MAG: hypothetical protein J0H09_29845 [Burkholderiales bacterium]|nr:hypothetical protein [Burkholderiales bacterium]